MEHMARRQILPAVSACAALAEAIAAKRAVAPSLACAYETGSLSRLSVLTDQISVKTEVLEAAVLELAGLGGRSPGVLCHSGPAPARHGGAAGHG